MADERKMEIINFGGKSGQPGVDGTHCFGIGRYLIRKLINSGKY